MRHLTLAVLILAGLALAACADDIASPPQPPPPVPAAQPRLGINLTGPSDWNTELPFVDVFRLSRKWAIHNADGSSTNAPALDLDEHGWVKSLPDGCYVETPMMTFPNGHKPSGTYTVLYDGEGTIAFRAGGTITDSRPGRILVDVKPGAGTLWLQIRATDPANYIRDIRVLMPGHEQTYHARPFNPDFLKLWKGVACVRFMDLMKTNNSTIVHWSDRPTVDDATWTIKGLPVETLCDLANALGADVWFCMPHQADDDFVRRFAEVVRDRLDPSHKAYIEYSNEVWNAAFDQYAYAAQRGQALGFAEPEWSAAWRWTSYRSVQIFDIWESVFGGLDRLVRVLPTQASSKGGYVATRIVGFQSAYQHADVLAIAPYFSAGISLTPEAAATVATWTPDQLLDAIEQTGLPQVQQYFADNKAVADQYGLKLVAYEGGQHLVGRNGGENNDALNQLLYTVNSHPRMACIYGKYLDSWKQAGGDLFCHFSSVARWDKWGSWGATEYLDSLQAPKLQAILKWAKLLGQPVVVPETP